MKLPRVQHEDAQVKLSAVEWGIDYFVNMFDEDEVVNSQLKALRTLVHEARMQEDEAFFGAVRGEA